MEGGYRRGKVLLRRSVGGRLPVRVKKPFPPRALCVCSPPPHPPPSQVLEMLAIFTYYTKHGISAQLWSLWPQLHTCLLEWGIDYWENILVPLDNMISRGTEHFLGRWGTRV